jgi:hypothetical protein
LSESWPWIEVSVTDGHQCNEHAIQAVSKVQWVLRVLYRIRDKIFNDLENHGGNDDHYKQLSGDFLDLVSNIRVFVRVIAPWEYQHFLQPKKSWQSFEKETFDSTIESEDKDWHNNYQIH